MIWGLQGAWLQLYVRRVEGLDKGMIVLTCQNNLWSVSGYFGVYLADVEGFEADEAFEVVGEGAEAVEAIVKDLERGEVERGRKRSLLEFTFSFFSFLSSKPMLSGSCISLLKLAFSSSNDPQL